MELAFYAGQEALADFGAARIVRTGGTGGVLRAGVFIMVDSARSGRLTGVRKGACNYAYEKILIAAILVLADHRAAGGGEWRHQGGKSTTAASTSACNRSVRGRAATTRPAAGPRFPAT